MSDARIGALRFSKYGFRSIIIQQHALDGQKVGIAGDSTLMVESRTKVHKTSRCKSKRTGWARAEKRALVLSSYGTRRL